MKQAMIIVNPTSGKEEAQYYAKKAANTLIKVGYTVTVNETKKELDATYFCQDACQEKFDLVVSAGGDGTLHETINGMVDSDYRPILAVIPLGTVNDFARALQIPLNPEKAIHVLQSTTTRKADIGKVNNQLFINVIAAGKLAESLSGVPSDEKSKLGFFAYVKEGFKTLVENAASHLTITYDNKRWEGDSILFVAALTNSVGGFEQLAPSAEIDDGLLHCFVVKDTNWFDTAVVGTSLLAGNLENSRHVHAFTAKTIRAESTETITTNIDGESGTRLPIDITLLPSHIDVLIPESI
ncbi:diacylglycerol/lipid kinase family protein [Shouchella patagoniensis]|uniref:diacylglycerol/lipid kinase family protein n=1 Tax=Shouchella patagoniensis TaxID=228576 RepID=UPI000995A101|nr:diacylglycerol kinase family protein [Shouchella patagoniensis]